MKDEVIVIDSELKNQLVTIDEEKLPQIFADQIHFLKKQIKSIVKRKKKKSNQEIKSKQP